MTHQFADEVVSVGVAGDRASLVFPRGGDHDLDDTYGRDRANALLSGLVQSVVLRVGDSASVEYARSQLGREEQQRTVPVHGREGRSIGRQELRDEAYPIAESDLKRLEDGEVIAVVPEGWMRGRLSRLADIRENLDHALERDS